MDVSSPRPDQRGGEERRHVDGFRGVSFEDHGRAGAYRTVEPQLDGRAARSIEVPRARADCVSSALVDATV